MTSDKKINVKTTGFIAIAVMISRTLGLVREVIFNSLFGASLMGVFLIAFRAPNLLRDLFAEGALSISFISVFSKKIEIEGEQSAWELATKILTLTCCLMSVLTLLGIFFAEYLINILAPGFTTEDARSVILLTQIMFPFILLVSLASLVMGMLNSKNVFNIPALASSLFNIGSILGGTLIGWLLDHHFGRNSLIGLAIGTIIGGTLQLSIQIPSLLRCGFRFRFDWNWKDSGVRNVVLLTLPAVITASALQINILINSCFASYMGKEVVTWLNSAFRLIQLPIGIFGIAIATTTLPVISRIAATKDQSHFGPTLGYAMRLGIFLTMPAAIGLWFFAEPIIKLIYEHGKFEAIDSMQTSKTLQFYALGLIGYACTKVIAPAFYAINQKWTPMCVSFATIAINISLNYFFIFTLNMGHIALALSTAISASFNFVTLYMLMGRAHNLQTHFFIDNLVRCCLASTTLCIACWLCMNFFSAYIYSEFFSIRCLSLVFSIFVAMLTYMSASVLLRVEMARKMMSSLSKRVMKPTCQARL